MKQYISALLLVVIASFPLLAFTAEGAIDLKVTSETNFAKSTGIEICGTAIHKSGTTPLLITIQHDESYYTTLTAPNGVWCQLIKRWTYSGEFNVSASSLSSPSLKETNLKLPLK